MEAAVVDRRNIRHEATAVRATFAEEQLPEVMLGLGRCVSQTILPLNPVSCDVDEVLKLDLHFKTWLEFQCFGVESCSKLASQQLFESNGCCWHSLWSA